MTPELKQFYAEIKAWVDEGCPYDLVFDVHASLCNNLKSWCFEWGLYEDWYALDREHRSLFVEEGLEWRFPFNEGVEDCERERLTGTFYQSPSRRDWIDMVSGKSNRYDK